MSQKLIDRSPDLKRLRDEGFDLEIRSTYLLIKHIPYVNSEKKVQLGTLVSELTLAGEKTTRPNTHALYFAGEYPCDQNGEKITQIANNSQQTTLGDIVVNHYFSCHPTVPYKDYYEKMMTYITIISGPAKRIDPNATANIFPVIVAETEESVFNYYDTASSRAGIGAVSSKLAQGHVAIVGLGGTGSYILDLVAKTPVGEIHLFDGDKYLNHNAFRSPGAPSVEDLEKVLTKVEYFTAQYSRMHRHIIPHKEFITPGNVELLQMMDFIFLSMDKGSDKRVIVDRLVEWGKSFIDVGMGVHLVDDSLLGVLRVTASTNNKRDHLTKRIPYSGGDENNDYAQNIQVADLNALNAALAVVKWKKLCGFYQDLENEHHSTYSINVNMLDSNNQL